MIEAIKYFFYFLLSIQIKHIVNATLYIVHIFIVDCYYAVLIWQL